MINSPRWSIRPCWTAKIDYQNDEMDRNYKIYKVRRKKIIPVNLVNPVHFQSSLHVALRCFESMRSRREGGRTPWERRHPCLLASASRSLAETTQARMPALPGGIFIGVDRSL
jgi:hypothetical protein